MEQLELSPQLLYLLLQPRAQVEQLAAVSACFSTLAQRERLLANTFVLVRAEEGHLKLRSIERTQTVNKRGQVSPEREGKGHSFA